MADIVEGGRSNCRNWDEGDENKINGNVGIGTTAPATKLDVAGGINFTGRISNQPNSGTGGFGALVASGSGDISAGTFVISANEMGVVYLLSWTNGNDHGRISAHLVGGAFSNTYAVLLGQEGAADVTHSLSISSAKVVSYTMTDDTGGEALDGWNVNYMKTGQG